MDHKKQQAQALNDFLLALKDGGEQTRTQVMALNLLFRALFDSMGDEQKEAVLKALENSTSNSPSAIAGISAEILGYIALVLPEFASRRRLS